MSINLGVYNGLNLQGGASTQVPGVATANPIQGTIAPAATSPSSPKQKYIQTQAQQIQPTNLQPTNNGAGLSFMNGSINAQGQYVANQAQSTPQSSQPSNPAPQGTGTSLNGTSTGIPGQGTYDPYNSPAYQQYVQTAASAYLPNPQIASYQQQLQNLQAGASQTDINLASTPGLSGGAMLGQQALAASQYNQQEQNAQTGLSNALVQQGYQQQSAAIPLTAANTEASYLTGLATPQNVASGNTLTQLNPATGQTTPLASVGSYGLGTGIAGQPITYSTTGGQINSGGTTLGSTPPVLSGTSNGTASVAGAVSSALQSLGVGTDPTTSAFYTNAVNQALANGGNPDPSLTAQQASVVKQILSTMSGGQYSGTASAINLANQTAQSQAAQTIVPIAQTALTNLAALQKLSDAVGYSNSPIANNIRNQFSNSVLTDPSINTLQSALQFVTGEVSQVLGGGSSSLAALNDAQTALNAGSISPATLKSVIANATTMVNNRLNELQNPQNQVTVPNGLQMPAGYSGSNDTPTPGSLKL